MEPIDLDNLGEPWMRDAACASSALNIILSMSPSDEDEAAFAASLCATCRVLAACGQYAEHHDTVGVWAGVWHRPEAQSKRQSIVLAHWPPLPSRPR